MKDEQNNKRNLVFLIVGVLTLLVAIVGATYAFFQAQTGQGQSAKVNVATGTTDNLTFTIADIDVTDPAGDEGDKNIVDTHNKTSDAENAELVITANANNFGQTGTSLGDGVEATAKLVANDNTKTAEAKYNVYLVLDQNELGYTTTDGKPELLLTVHEPDNDTEYTEIVSNLSHHTKDTGNNKDVSGFDITGKREVIQIAKDYPIEVTDKSTDLTETQTWKVQVTLVNLASDQNKNTGKSVTGKVIITTEKDIKLSNINTLSIERTAETITATAVTEDTDNITEYYFKIDEGTPISRIAAIEDDEWQEETTATHVYNSLTQDKEYTLSVYGVDNNGFKTNVYETKIATGETALPRITSVAVTPTYNSIKVNVTADTDITNYEYSINGQNTVTEALTEHTFTGLKELTNYTITIVGIKGEERTLPYVINVQTLKHITYADTCDASSNSCQVVKTLLADAEEDTLLYHDASLENGANDNSYRFSGQSDKVNNYVCLDNQSGEETCDNADLYRVIGLFKNDQSEYEMKLIKADYTTSEMLGGTEEGGQTTAYKGNYSYSTSNYTGKGAMDTSSIAAYYWTSSENQSNLWKDSALNTYNLNQKFTTYLDTKKTDITSHIVEHEWITAGNTYDNIYNKNVKEAYQNEIVSYNRGTANNQATEEDDKTTAKIGLMYVSDYGYAASQDSWTKQTLYNYNKDNIPASNWMYMGLSEWTITRQAGASNDAFFVNGEGSVDYRNYVGTSNRAVRPSFYLKSSTEISSGKGTKESPYRIIWEGQA